MSYKICTVSANSVGCTFVDWSIHFLSNKNKFYSVLNSKMIPLTANPLTEINAHAHKKNHPSGFAETKKYIEDFNSKSNLDLLTLYAFPLHIDLVAKNLKLDNVQRITSGLLSHIRNAQCTDYTDMVNYCLDQNCKVIHVELNEKNVLYSRIVRDAKRLFLDSRYSKDSNEWHEHMNHLFCAESIEKWKTMGLTNIWDQRERLALSIEFFNFDHCRGYEFDRSKPYLWIDAQSLWYHGEHAMKKIMSFCELSIDSERWNRWISIYRKWQEMQLKILEFDFNYKHIVDSIVNNWYYEIGELTFLEEVIIQHCLIFYHGLNLKTWQLEKFPKNTQDLHKLLEPNIHPLHFTY